MQSFFMYTVYVIKSHKDGRLYTGQTENLSRRLNEHNTGIGPVRYTKGKGPWELVYKEDFISRSTAMAREKYLKSGAGRDFLKIKISK
jgi:putative endonuclease